MVSFYRRHDGSLEVKLEAGVLRLALRTGSRDLPKAWHRCREPIVGHQTPFTETLRAHFCPAQHSLEDEVWKMTCGG
jgi:hypothetical protein